MKGDALLDKGLPANLDTEHLVLGSMLSYWESCAPHADILKDEHFSTIRNQRIFRAVMDLSNHGKAVDRVLVAEHLQRSGLLQAVGGLTALVDLDDSVPRIYNIDQYFRVLIEYARRRDLIKRAMLAIERAQSGDDVAEIEDSFVRGGVRATEPDIPDMKGVADLINEIDGGLSAVIDTNLRPRGVSTGIASLDRITNGLRPGQLIIIAGRPGMGKSALAMNIAANAAQMGKAVGIFSLEMSPISLLERMACAEGAISGSAHKAGLLSDADKRAFRETLTRLAELKLYINAKGGVTASTIRSRLERMKARHGLDLAIVDYLQLITPRGSRENRNVQVAEISRALKEAAVDLGVPVIALSQMSRGDKENPRRPQLTDLRDSGAIEQDADVVSFVHRPEYYYPDKQELRGLAELIIAKQREGATGTLRLWWSAPQTKFSDWPE